LTLILICRWPGSGSGTAARFGTSGGPYPVAANGNVSVVAGRHVTLAAAARPCLAAAAAGS